MCEHRGRGAPSVVLGVDVSGTTTGAGPVTAQGEVIVEESVPTRERADGLSR